MPKNYGSFPLDNERKKRLIEKIRRKLEKLSELIAYYEIKSGYPADNNVNKGWLKLCETKKALLQSAIMVLLGQKTSDELAEEKQIAEKTILEKKLPSLFKLTSSTSYLVNEVLVLYGHTLDGERDPHSPLRPMRRE